MKIYLWDKGPIENLLFNFRVLEFAPSKQRDMWTYATCCMSQLGDKKGVEVHIFSSKRDESLIELLFASAFYHRNNKKLDLWHTINFGRPWQDDSKCEYGLFSLPYLDGPDLENLTSKDNWEVNFYWLIPITKLEVEFKSKYGIELLEGKFEQVGLDYINPNRDSSI